MPYVAGQYHQICDVCGFKFLSLETRIRWDGLLVCPADYETDHPQKYIRVSSDGQGVPIPRPPSSEQFVLQVYCTPVTRTCAAENGTADCMTVDYALNINYPMYGGYPLIYPPVAPTLPGPFLLDTFTATDGTDPTARDMDVFPSGGSELRRWRGFSGDTHGEIYSNSLRNSTADATRLLLYADDNNNFCTLMNTTILVHYEILDTVGGDLRLAVIDQTGNQEIRIEADGDGTVTNVEANVFGLNGGDPGWNPPVYTGLGNAAGGNKTSIHTSDTTATLIHNGVVLGSTSIVEGGPWLEHTWATVDVRTGNFSGTNIFAVSIYNGATLEEAIALTENLEVPPESIYESGIYELGIYE